MTKIPDPHPDPLVRGMDPRIRIRIIKIEDVPIPEKAVYEVAGRGIRALHEALLHTLHDRVPFPKSSQT